MLKNYKELKVWQKFYKLFLRIYKITAGFPKDERFGLVSQIRRTAGSIPSNVAEGYGRKTTPDYIRDLFIACGSICELETQILLSEDLRYIDPAVCEEIKEEIQEVERMLKALTRALEEKHSNPLMIDFK